MSPAVRLFHARLERRAAALAPDLRRALLRAFDRLQQSITDADLEAFIRTPSAERLLYDVLTPQRIEAAFAPVQRALRDGVESAGQAAVKDLPRSAADVQFNVLSPVVVDGIRALDDRAINTLKVSIRETVRAYVEHGLRQGINPREVARGLQATIGLAPNQADAVVNFEAMLRAGDPEVLTRALRDRRFDGTIRKALASGQGFTDDQIARMTQAYRERMLAFNADTNARTMALDAQRVGHQLTWDQAVAQGHIDGGRLFKRWATVKDDRVRPEHRAMEGEVVRYDEHFSNGEMVPGESTFNCRCIAVYQTSRDPATARKPGAGDTALVGAA